jgi:hypothetical protein
MDCAVHRGAGRWQSHIHNTRTELRSVSIRLSRQTARCAFDQSGT